MLMARESQGEIPEGQILQVSSFLCRDVDRLTEMVAACLAQQGPAPGPGIHKTGLQKTTATPSLAIQTQDGSSCY